MVHEIEIQPHLLLTIVTELPAERHQRGTPHLSALARRCASAAMQRLGNIGCSDAPSVSIGRGPLGEPLFPSAFKGSLAHTPGWACALVTDDDEFLSVGVDVEALGRPFRPAIASRIASALEKSAIAAWQNNEALAPYWRSGLALFCAKEAVVKALSPLLKRPVVLSEISLTCTPETNRFELSSGTTFAQPIHGYIITWRGALIAYAVSSTLSPVFRSSLTNED